MVVMEISMFDMVFHENHHSRKRYREEGDKLVVNASRCTCGNIVTRSVNVSLFKFIWSSNHFGELLDQYVPVLIVKAYNLLLLFFSV